MNSSSGNRPNFLVIVADDLGFSDVGCFGSEIHTPHIDALALEGTRFTDFHTAAACSPTRSMLMSGTDHHLTGLGQLVEMVMNSPAHQGKPGHEGYLTSNIATLPEVLRDGGYHTMMSGKWHLGLTPEASPKERGFSRSFALLPPASNHYGWDPTLEPGAEEPRMHQVNVVALHMEGDEYIDNATLPSTFYSSDYYVDKLLEYMDERPPDKPFFAYLPFSAPHWPLQAPRENMDRYRGVYADGPDVLRLRRLEALQREGLIPKDIQAHPVVAPEVPEWAHMDDMQRAKSARAMEAYAGMVDRLDYNVGRAVAYLKAHGLYEDTEIIFMSDNGAEGHSYEAAPLTGGKTLSYIKKYYNNTLDNIGSATSFVWYGARWAQAATAPSRLYKKFSTEGGVRVPFILKQPRDRTSGICHEFCTVMDLMPTMLEQAEVAKPGDVYAGREVLSMRGSSWMSFLTHKAAHIHDEEHTTGWELGGQAALRKGRWKINHVDAPYGPEAWQLFDLSKDPGETYDLADIEREKKDELVQAWQVYARETGVVGLTREFQEINQSDEMKDPTAWMKFETSRSVAQAHRLTHRQPGTIKPSTMTM